MKREYVKPRMEGEAFTPNEYVASCWIVSCSDCGNSELFMKAPNFAGSTTNPDSDGDGFFTLLGNQVYTGTINGAGPDEHTSYDGEWWWNIIRWIFGWRGDHSYYHTVSVQSGDNGNAANYSPNHPNASA